MVLCGPGMGMEGLSIYSPLLSSKEDQVEILIKFILTLKQEILLASMGIFNMYEYVTEWQTLKNCKK